MGGPIFCRLNVKFLKKIQGGAYIRGGLYSFVYGSYYKDIKNKLNKIVNLYENITPPEKLCKSGFGKSLFILSEDSSNIYFSRTNTKICSSPFINVVGLGISKATFERTKLEKDENSKNKNVIIVGTIAEGSVRGNKAIVNTSFLDKDEFCIFDDKNNKIE